MAMEAGGLAGASFQNAVYIRGARVLDPGGQDGDTGRVRPLLLYGDRLAAAPPEPPPGVPVVEAAGLTAVPGLIDLHVHLREPGDEAAETIASGSHAAVAGGFSYVVCMPNTKPPLDTPALLEAVQAAAKAAGYATVLPSACLTRGRAGEEVADLEALAEAGAACFTDDGSTVARDAVMRAAMVCAARLGRVVMDHAQDPAAERAGVMHEGAAARALGLPGIPSEAEVSVIERDIRLAAATGCALHIQHLSSAAGADRVRRARAEGRNVTAEVTPHHLALCDADILPGDASFKMNPPLRSAEDREALAAALCDGTITCLATDHAPHTREAKERGFLAAPFGVLGLETAVGVTWTHLVRGGRMTPLAWLRLWTTGPAAVLGRPAPSLQPGAPADVALLDLEAEWTVDPARFASRSRNTCFAGHALVGHCRMLFHAGRRVFG